MKNSNVEKNSTFSGMKANTTGHISLSSEKKIDITDKNSTSSEMRADFTKQISAPSGMTEDIIEKSPAQQNLESMLIFCTEYFHTTWDESKW